jgi:tetratricopeptide (TPR) repeat protein
VPACLLTVLAASGAGGVFSKGDRHARGPALLEWDPSVRAEGMGGAFVGVSDDGGALFWNPAGLGQVPRTELALGYAEEFGEQTRGDLRFVRPVWRGQERRTWGVRMAYSSVNPFELTENGSVTGTVHPQDFVLGASYEQPLGPVFVGGTLKGIRQDISVDAASTWATDLGVMGRGKRIRWGASALNLGPALQTNTGPLALPIHFLGGGSWLMVDRQRGGGRGSVLAVVQLDAPMNDTVGTQMGIEVTRNWANRIAVSARMGYRSSSGDLTMLEKMTIGLGFVRESLGVNYAYLPQEELGGIHRFEIFLRLGDPLEPETRRNALLRQAETLYAEKRMVRARAAVEEVLAISPKNAKARTLQKKIDSRIATSLDPETLFILGDRAFEEKRYEQAADFFKRLVEVSPSYPGGLERWEKAEGKAGDERLRVAESRLKEERRREGQSRRARAERMMAQKNWTAAWTAWENVLALFPNDRSAEEGIQRCRAELYASAVAAERKGEWGTAIDLYRASQSSGKTFKDSAERLAALRSRVAAEEAALDERRQEESKGLYEKGMAAYSLKNFEKAQSFFEQALRANPNDKKTIKALERLKEERGGHRP